MPSRAEIEVETLLKVVLALVILWIGLEVLELVTDILDFVLGPFKPLVGLLIAVLIVLWLLDRI